MSAVAEPAAAFKFDYIREGFINAVPGIGHAHLSHARCIYDTYAVIQFDELPVRGRVPAF